MLTPMAQDVEANAMFAACGDDFLSADDTNIILCLPDCAGILCGCGLIGCAKPCK